MTFDYSTLIAIALVGTMACGPAPTDPEARDPVSGIDAQTEGKADAGASSTDSGPVSDAGQPAVDAGQPAVDAGVPTACPCGLDYVCDLGTNTCQPGCFDDQGCSNGKFCDPRDGICRLGCRTVSDCQDDGNLCTDLACVDGACEFSNNSAPCSDDGNACTRDACRNGSCQHAPTNNGQVCGSTGECSAERCDNGQCVMLDDPVGEPCDTDENSCTDDVCDGNGSCTHEVLPDETLCDDIWPGGWDAKCFSGTCAPLRYRCSNYSTLYYHQFSTGTTDTWDGTTGCGCDGRTMRWRGWYSGYFLEHDEYCAACIVDGSTADCYDLPP